MKRIAVCRNWVLLLSLLSAANIARATTNIVLLDPVIDRWNYGYNPSPADRSPASVFGAFGDPNLETRLGQHLFGFDTSSVIATNLGATNYLVRKATLTISINRGQRFRYDPTQDALNTYFATNQPGYQADADLGRPIELFGAGFRNGFTQFTYVQDSDFGIDTPGGRNAYAAGWSTNGELVDVSNNVGKTNEPFLPFEVHPFAIGQTTNVAPGELVSSNAHFTFTLNLNDPLVRQYVQQALASGRLSLSLSSLHDSSFGGAPAWPDFFTHFSALGEHPFLELQAVAVTPTDSDGDGLPDDWENYHFGSLNQAAADDPDHDGLSNLAEYRAGTDPTDAASVLKVVSVTRDEAGVVVRFQFAASKQYAIEYSPDLENWEAVEDPALTYYAAPEVAEWRDDGTQTGGLAAVRYYRLRIK